MDRQTSQDDFLPHISANRGLIIKICNAYGTHKADREDLAQEIMLTLWKGRASYKPDYKFSTWMYKVALNVAISYYRRSKKAKGTILFPEFCFEVEEPPPDSPDAEEQSGLLQKHVAALPSLDKALIILYFEEKSYKEIAEIIGITETNVATKVSRIKEKLKQNIINSQKL